jgi:hypothetical protein
MSGRIQFYLVFSMMVFLMMASIILDSVSADISMEQHDALVAFYYAANGDDWYDNSNWLGRPGTEHTWIGVTINA